MTGEPGAYFISLEGGEGAGKSTQHARIVEWLKSAGREVVETREPGGTPVSEQVRQVLLDTRNAGLDPVAELLLMFAARAEHLAKVVWPAMQAGHWVLCDRFTDATYAYQGGGRGVPMDRIEKLEDWVQGELRPNHTLLLDMPVADGLQRAGARSEPDRFEQEQHAFFERVRETYLARAKQEPERIHVIDASPALDVVQLHIAEVLQRILKS